MNEQEGRISEMSANKVSVEVFCPVLNSWLLKRHGITGRSQKKKKSHSLANMIYEDRLEERKFF